MQINYHNKKFNVKATQYYNGNLAILLAGSNGDYDVISTNFDFLGIKGAAYVDVNNFPDIEDLLLKTGIAEKTPLTKQSGFVTYPLYIFNMEILREESPQVIMTKPENP